MATIPIEVIVQDAENPVGPTPVGPTDSGDNTNITVPDTGAGTVDSNNSGINNSSAAISIVSIIIAVLAIGAVITLLVRKYHKRKTSEVGMTRQERRAVAATSTIAVLALTVLLGQLVVAGVVSPIATNAATDDTVNDEAELDVDSKITIIATRTEDEDTVVATVKNTSTATSHQTFGYKVTASMASGVTTTNLYLDGDETSEYCIAPVVDDTLSNNTWGYTLAETSEDYLPIPLANSPTTIVKGTNNIDNEPVDIYYTVQVDKDLPAGTYTGEIEYNIGPAIEYMQDLATLTSEEKSILLTNMTQDEQYILIDNRDKKSYYISKLADGKVWMTQNLDLDLNNQTALTPGNTNISANWTPANSTIAFTGTTVDGWQNNYNVPYSADPGAIYIYSSGTTNNDERYTSLEACRAIHPDCSVHNYVGNYYNWSAAVASNNTTELKTQYNNAPGSICPAGWRLPTSGDSDNTAASHEWYVLMMSEGIIGDDHSYTANGFNKTRVAPLWLVRSGRVITRSLSSIGDYGEYWSSTVGSENHAYRLFFSSSFANTDYRYDRDFGLPVRCLTE